VTTVEEGDDGTGARGRRALAPVSAERLAWWMRVVALLVRVGYRCTTRIRVHGLDRVPSSGPLIIIANHTSNADPPVVGAWLQGRVGRPIRFMAKAQLWDSPLRPIVSRYRAILVRPGGSDVEAYRLGRQVLVDGGVLGLFPEGTRSPTGVLLDAHQGVTLLAARTGATVLPVGISGTDRFLPAGSGRPRIGGP
jgi:1-acyl-sn-glycerol-3-phosphate acyltransferase